MFHRKGLLLVLLAAAWHSSMPAGADEPAKSKAPSVTDIKLEVEALQTLYYLKVTSEQMRLLQKLAKETAEAPRERQGKASDEFIQDLKDFHAALVDASDEDRIEALDEAVDQRSETEHPDIDDDWGITAAARMKLPEFLKELKAPQLAHFLEGAAELDPLDHLVDSLVKVRTLPRKEWLEKRDETAENIAHMLAGIDQEKYERINDQVIGLLSKARAMKDDEFKQQQAELEKAAQKITGTYDAMDVLKNVRDYQVAKLLSNPRLAAAIEARLQK